MTEWWAAGCRETARRFVLPLCVAGRAGGSAGKKRVHAGELRQGEAGQGVAVRRKAGCPVRQPA